MTRSVRIRFIITGLMLGVSLLTGCGAKDGGANKESVNSLESADSTVSVSDYNGKKQPITSLNRLAQPGVTIAVGLNTRRKRP